MSEKHVADFLRVEVAVLVAVEEVERLRSRSRHISSIDLPSVRSERDADADRAVRAKITTSWESGLRATNLGAAAAREPARERAQSRCDRRGEHRSRRRTVSRQTPGEDESVLTRPPP